MPIQFPCSQCSQVMRVDDRHAGAKVRCPRCGGITLAPAAPTRPPAPARTGSPKPSPPGADDDEPVIFNQNLPDEEMDMTPMIDVTFLLLIFFMVTAAFALQKSLEIPTPDDDKAVTQQRVIVDPEEGNIVVRIDKDSTVWIDESEAPSKQDLLVKLRDARQGVPGSDSPPINSLLVMADGEARHEVVVMALDAGNAVGMEQVKLAIVDEDDF